MFLVAVMSALAETPDRSDVDAVLDALHTAATDADFDGYFALFHPEAVFVGTDRTEVWTVPEFRAFAEPHFAEPPAWAYTPGERRVAFGPKGRTAWFFEELRHERYGDVRGSGALVREGDRWLVSLYVLSFPIPNEAAPAVVDLVQGHARTLPPPFTADQIRASYVPGLTLTTRKVLDGIESASRTEVVAADAETVTMRFVPLDANGVPIGDPVERQSAWTELRDHAAFPVSGTTWEDVALTVPLGTFPCRRYDLTDGETTRSFWFSPAHPGQPMRVTAGDGYVMEIVARSVP